MYAIIYFTGILILANLNCINTFVVTRFDSPTITKYYRSFYDRSHRNSDIDQFFQHQNLPQFCQQLRESIYFDRTNNTDVSYTGDCQFLSWTMSAEDLMLEEYLAVIRDEYHYVHAGSPIRLPSFTCLDPVGVRHRIIAPGIVPNTAVISTLSFDQTSQRWKMELTAVIDASAVIGITPNFNDFLEARSESLMYFIVQSNDNLLPNCNIMLNKGGHQRDPLCDLKKLLKYRLCAAASIGLRQIDYSYVYNLFYQPENDEESCRSLEGTDPKLRSYPKMLYCTVKYSTSEEFESFYLSLDVLETKSVLFIRQVWNGSQYELKTKYLFVPLLEHLELYEEALKDLDI